MKMQIETYSLDSSSLIFSVCLVQEQYGERDAGEEDVSHLLFFVDVLLLTLLDAIHVALIRSLKSHVETRSSKGSELASKCPRRRISYGNGQEDFYRNASSGSKCGRLVLDPRRSGHRGFGFVTFAEDGVTDCISRRSHVIRGQQVAKDTSTPIDDY
ncbi:hypothetical protein HanRHA438_Chr08g0351471 [Helianthus annuus]|uniref:Nucleotide-binding alpha-beta plait domain-containing protein n=1 Tax=Helianthus annuus TaxID=4232 RepID=A0A9K3IEK4_HELAN|nr:hypothetical protein HanXRQr2_Chr08g0340081 [Helianthus annuus]KAJ0538975.1 hypothetical protein HanHA300_Chr08g0281031 [Helianthus annuus]KAJ0553609.1 hypothetical protein HanHA89_Chr08g0298281 [Helianthus annuus]KAJ0719273.1 hypothetical protein HanLR1_Chr08g0279861 [Helianthus annuus]KAJ0722508.1 hypothetical protein HanOQP8_Chr08g0287411 [Helianthus annuus]